MVRVLGPWLRRPEAPDASALRPGVHDLFRDDRMMHRMFPGARNFPGLPGAGRTLAARNSLGRAYRAVGRTDEARDLNP